ncbi:hypothetical protein K501DRAFT_189219, partial [Backusella circina FSU 941]
MKSIQKKDSVVKEVQEVFYNKIEETVKTSSSYSANFGALVYAIMMAMGRHCFVKDEDTVRPAPFNSGHVSRFLPKDFHLEKDMPIPSPLTSHTVLEDPDDALKADFSRLFTQEHLQNIHSSYFGPKGISEKTLGEHPLHRAILRLIPKDGTFPLKTQAEPAVMSSALGTYCANIKTMWKGTGIFTKSLNNLLTVLLKVHLAPKK